MDHVYVDHVHLIMCGVDRVDNVPLCTQASDAALYKEQYNHMKAETQRLTMMLTAAQQAADGAHDTATAALVCVWDHAIECIRMRWCMVHAHGVCA